MLHKEAERLKEIPVFLFGLSMGGGTVLEMAFYFNKSFFIYLYFILYQNI
jgi:surfactin synthase thioesterase subunit